MWMTNKCKHLSDFPHKRQLTHGTTRINQHSTPSQTMSSVRRFVSPGICADWMSTSHESSALFRVIPAVHCVSVNLRSLSGHFQPIPGHYPSISGHSVPIPSHSQLIPGRSPSTQVTLRRSQVTLRRSKVTLCRFQVTSPSTAHQHTTDTLARPRSSHRTPPTTSSDTADTADNAADEHNQPRHHAEPD